MSGDPAIETRSGRLFSLVDPQPEDVDIVDIAHSLSQLCRYTGHTSTFYSVAQHCLHVSQRVSPESALAGLLHDASETYIGDIHSPLKRYLDWATDGDMRRFEDRILEVIFEKFNVPWPMLPEIKEADLRSMATEVRDFMPGNRTYWAGLHAEPYPEHLASWTPHAVRDQYLLRFKELS